VSDLFLGGLAMVCVADEEGVAELGNVEYVTVLGDDG
jgi:hypothetical protein